MTFGLFQRLLTAQFDVSFRTRVDNNKARIRPLLVMAFDLKDETEVKEYIEKLGVEYRFGCYSEKNPEGTFCYPTFR